MTTASAAMPKKKKKRLSVANMINYVVLFLLMFICVYPMWYIFINSFSTPASITRGVFILPYDFSTEAYQNLGDITNIGSSIVVAVSRTVLGTILTVFCCSFCAYILAHRYLPCKKLFYRLFIVTMYLNAGFIPYYLTVSGIGLRNNFLVYILPYAVQAYFIILIKTYIESIPGELVESAEIDGAGIVRIYWQMILPLSKPILATIVVFAAVNQWNTWSDDMYFMQGRNSANLHCLQYLLYQELQACSVVDTTCAGAAAGAGIKVSPTSLRMAMSFVTIFPILCVYPFMQRYFTKAIMLGAGKG